jgi:biopolymer transport protein ExbB
VAIPALFAYNYIGSRIKGVSADMRVFADEFLTRLAESYG